MGRQRAVAGWMLAVAFAGTAAAQQARPAYPVSGPVVIGVPGFENTPDAQAKAAEETQTKAEIMDLANKIEAATVRGDVAYLDSVLDPSFTMIHGSGWTQGEKVTGADHKADYLNRAKNHEYLVHDIDPSSIHFEFHGDIVITYGRYISLYVPAQRSATFVPALNSIWFERVYQKKDGKWVYLTHRSVRVANSPAGIDPGAVTEITMHVQGPGILQGTTINFEGNGTGTGLTLPGGRGGGAAAGGGRAGAGVAAAGAAGAGRGGATPWAPPAGVVYTGTEANPNYNGGSGGGMLEPFTDNSPEAQELLALERKMGDAVPAGDAQFWGDGVSEDFQMTHGNIWTRGGLAQLVDNKQSFLQRVKTKQYNAFIVDQAKQRVEMHGNVAITYGRYVASIKGFPASQAWFSCWYMRVFEKQNGKWIMVSHRTVHDPARAATREALGDL